MMGFGMGFGAIIMLLFWGAIIWLVISLVNTITKIANPKILQACDLMREVLLEKLSGNEKLAKRIL